MVSPIPNLGFLDPTQPAYTPPSSSSTSTSSSSSSSTSGTSNSPPTTTSPQAQLSAEVLSLLQTFAPGGTADNTTSSLLGISNSSDNTLLGGLTSVLSGQAYAAALQTAISTTEQASQAPTTNPVQSLITSYNAASNAYNNTLLQQAQAVLAANNGTLPTDA